MVSPCSGLGVGPDQQGESLDAYDTHAARRRESALAVVRTVQKLPPCSAWQLAPGASAAGSVSTPPAGPVRTSGSVAAKRR